eukprot:TRINITY_DN63667_c0_g1_i1.p1 TRINITY_DN63667_c0_g1~~TRINITY_DN63667_c0_g1_i1.p1  ORF type:complete len:240 (+),score=60.50 TRINITY_DN63667_c0_g1_i1:118-837(+)
MTVLTLEYIKQATGEFDAETVFQAILSDKSIQRIDAIGRCCNLRWLDLSRNQIVKMENLRGLSELVFLDLSFNKIEVVQGLAGLAKLEKIGLQSNPIARLQDLEGLGDLRKLKHVHFQNIDGTDSCPVCSLPDYKKTVLELCPNLDALDSKRRMLPDIAAEVRALEQPIKLDLPEPEKWFSREDLDFEEVQDADAIAAQLDPQVAELESAMAECKSAMQEAESLLALAMEAPSAKPSGS